MPLYELFCIASHNPTSPAGLRQLIRSVATQVHGTGGVVRDLRALGAGLTLPYRMKRNQQFHERGDHFSMTFDTSPVVLKRINETLRRDPMVVRWMLTKKGAAVSQLNTAPSSTVQMLGPEDMGRY
ncbi:hypothetical protein CcaverHIS002_0701920 [Cutaneotrichosporon cavernicola]|uniref:Ribosomal protein S6 n=1 Tax=Cutaneotrichosporon cavernicola TaxID=279322 RepID=A0AA48QYK0_9TREE|nr:uncharacterized protein CcaverHIS019_0701940 [Cutaneotrichosporon cavernicola]BEI86846.1 hypothetical protein CcaverHIS002_0701920 [Cutaneotrichosporon cavernicola]BEI94622.1 hypothetical protein CcaverHIS019_0701940 [Cutaneotrichosporon cavernicola]BEJ02399.1 hypothetical protein CcaverHIS631_0701940 [Cutaneotrichosporon cavernicola]BEJ10157.1 hypothetical protein CcaverHIS641_0701920 [Cutaneotrichosporon cavernicola]